MRSFSIPTLFSALAAFAILFSSVRGDSPLNLGAAGSFAILAGSTVTSSGTVGTVITGDIGVWPGSAVTGFPPAVLNGVVANNGDSGTAQGDLTAAYNALAAKAFTATLSTQDLGGMTLPPGVYKYDGTAAMNGMLTLDAQGNSGAIWTFQIGSSLSIAAASSVIFKDSIGNPDYVYWQVGTTATIATGVPMIGNILALNAIILNDGVTVAGRCLARNAEVTLDRTVITIPEMVAFSAQQTITCISVDQYNTNADLNTATLKTAIAQTMTGVGSNNIEEFRTSAGPTSAATMISLRGFMASKAGRALSTSSTIINYNVVVSSTMTAEQLQAQLAAAVQDGTFNTYLNNAATTNGATDLLCATSDGVDTQTITDNGGSDEVLSDGAIIGIAIGGFFGLVIIAAIVFFFCCRAAEK